jgi:hypothetical protein
MMMPVMTKNRNMAKGARRDHWPAFSAKMVMDAIKGEALQTGFA